MFVFFVNSCCTCLEQKKHCVFLDYLIFFEAWCEGFSAVGPHLSLHHSQLSVNLYRAVQSPHAFHLCTGVRLCAFRLRNGKIKVAKLAICIPTL